MSPLLTSAPDAATRSFPPRALVREVLEAFRGRFLERRVRIDSELPSRLPPSIPLEAEPVREVLRRGVEFALAEAGGRALLARADWRQGETGRAVFRLDLTLEGAWGPDAEAGLRRTLGEACLRAAAILTVEREGMERLRCGIAFPPVRLAALEWGAAVPARVPAAGGRDPAFATRHPLRILIVDDSDIGRKLTSRLLRNLGYEPGLAASGPEAIRMARETRYDLVFMDLRMPGMDGREAMLEIRKEAEGAPPFVVALTAEISEVERRRCLDDGMADFLTKPCRGEDLAETIRSLSAASRPRPASPEKRQPALPAPDRHWEAAEIIHRPTVQALRGLAGMQRPTLLEDLYESLRRDTPAIVGRARAALEAGDTPALRHELHQMTGNFEVLGARRMALYCRACSEAAHREAPGEVRALLDHFDEQFGALRLMLEEEIAQGRSGAEEN